MTDRPERSAGLGVFGRGRTVNAKKARRPVKEATGHKLLRERVRSA